MNLSVGISDWKIGKPPDVVVTYALGSCVGICLYDKKTKIAGLSHIMLPESTGSGEGSGLNRMKFADTAIPDMFNKMLIMGASRATVTAKIAGGATMFTTGASCRFNIGERNVASVKAALHALRIPILAQDTGADYGRTVFMYPEDGKVTIKSAGKGEKNI
ncbi:MAG: chemotaxis protein CheD [Oscillospiraceae bacterium]|nr:chemotaxis protein CheD [Oscillospiraceae bacterium]